MSMLFSSASAMASCTVRYSVPARTSSLNRGELARRTGGTSGARYGRRMAGACGATGAMADCCAHARGAQSSVIVGHEEDQVGACGRALACLHEGRSYRGQQKRTAVAVHADHGNAVGATD